MNDCKCCINKCPQAKMAHQIAEDRMYKTALLVEYIKLGSVEELRVAKEKQIPQKPKPSGKYGVCPSCSKLIERYEQKHGNIEIPHCKWCGQKLNWR